ncbi:MAG: oligosaccharide flippase family protein [Armatimonadetes bacterium]|nr:oligosaccharide flippase family protein [Armatimonadota bacterium]
MVTSRAARVIRDTSYLVAGQFVVGLASLLPSAWLARNLPSGELSAWPACVSLVAIIYTLSNFGFRDCFAREIPKLLTQGEDERACSLLRSGLLLVTISTLLLSVLAYLLAEPVTTVMLKNEVSANVVRLLAIAVFLATMATHLEWFQNAFQQYKMFAVSRTLRNVIRPVGSVVCYWMGGIEGAIIGLAIGPALGCIVGLISLWPRLRRGTGFAPGSSLLRISMPYFASGISAGLLSHADYVLVGAIGGTQSLATYYVAFKIIEYIAHVDAHLMDTMLPKLSEAAHRGRTAFQEGFTKCSRYYFLALVPLHIGLAAAGRPIITLYAGEEYSAAGSVFSVLCMYLLVQTFFSLYRQHVIALGNRWHPFVLDSLLALSGTLLIAVLSSYWGSMGAALARGLAPLLVLPVAVFLTRRVFEPRHSRQAVLLGATGGAMALCFTMIWSGAFRSSGLQALAILITPLLYLLMLRGQLRTEDIGIIRSLVPEGARNSDTGKRVFDALNRFYVRPSNESSRVEILPRQE